MRPNSAFTQPFPSAAMAGAIVPAGRTWANLQRKPPRLLIMLSVQRQTANRTRLRRVMSSESRRRYALGPWVPQARSRPI
eukprot:8888815-Alexandrium_andersonii.AAC.1